MTGESTMKAARSIATLVASAALVTAVACGKKTPPVARPAPPPPTTTAPTPPGPPAPPEPAREPVSVPAEPVRDDAISSASLDDLNKNSPLKPVYFELDSSELSAANQKALDDNAALLKRYPSWAVTVEGHCDERGTAEYNLALASAARLPRARTSSRWELRPIGCGPSATARSSRSIRVMTRRRSPKTGARISSSPRSEPMTHRVFGALLGVISPHAASPASAANKEHQQLMADLRMLQEQSQLLQNLIGSVTEALKAVNTRLDQQSETTRKAFADQKLVIDNLTNDVRIVREKAGRQQRAHRLAHAGGRLAAPVDAADRVAAVAYRDSRRIPVDGALPPRRAPTRRRHQPSRRRTVRSGAWRLLLAGQYDLAIVGFSEYIRSFPKSDLADDAQVNICLAYSQAGKNDKAVEACDLAIRTYPTGDKIPDAYYRKGIALQALRDLNGAREAWEHVVKTAPDSDAGRLAKQRLEQIKRPN
jgi:peptidoglycan-associated lipoprotein